MVPAILFDSELTRKEKMKLTKSMTVLFGAAFVLPMSGIYAQSSNSAPVQADVLLKAGQIPSAKEKSGLRTSEPKRKPDAQVQNDPLLSTTTRAPAAAEAKKQAEVSKKDSQVQGDVLLKNGQKK